MGTREEEPRPKAPEPSTDTPSIGKRIGSLLGKDKKPAEEPPASREADEMGVVRKWIERHQLKEIPEEAIIDMAKFLIAYRQRMSKIIDNLKKGSGKRYIIRLEDDAGFDKGFVDLYASNDSLCVIKNKGFEILVIQGVSKEKGPN
jgi:hypothetical protein